MPHAKQCLKGLLLSRVYGARCALIVVPGEGKGWACMCGACPRLLSGQGDTVLGWVKLRLPAVGVVCLLAACDL